MSGSLHSTFASCRLEVVILLALIFALTHANRLVSLELNPGCGDRCRDRYLGNDEYINLVHVKAEGDNDTVHYIWSTIGSFGIIMASTGSNTQLTIDWNRLLSSDPSSSISFSSPPYYTSAIMLTRLWAYEDVDDVADITKAHFNSTSQVPFHNFTWEEVKTMNVSETDVRAEFTLSTDLGDLYGNRTLKVILHAFGDTSHYNVLPMLPHSPTSTQLELILDEFVSGHNKSRFALEMALLYDESTTDAYEIRKLRSIDDEYTPGVFTTVQLTAQLKKSEEVGNFLLWKPVCYTMSDRTTEDSTDVRETFGNISFRERYSEMKDSVAYAFYGSQLPHLSVNFFNLSYGLEGDGFYDATNFLSWTVVMGLGAPPQETFSTLVIVVIVVGFGVPALLIVLGGLFVFVKRLRSRGDELQLHRQSKTIF